MSIILNEVFIYLTRDGKLTCLVHIILSCYRFDKKSSMGYDSIFLNWVWVYEDEYGYKGMGWLCIYM